MICEDFLPPAEFASVEREADEFMSERDPTWFHHHGTTDVRHFSLVGIDEERFPRLGEWRSHEQVLALASAAERRSCGINDGGSLVEHLTVGDYSEPDTQTDLHVDTFFNTHKIWLYLDDVSAENAAFVYVPGSHRLDGLRLREEYRATISTTEEDKSRRVTEDEVRRRGLERRVVSCRRNTLVVANTYGYHCRSVGVEGSTRRALHMAFRFNPFSSETLNPSRLKRAVVQGKRRLASYFGQVTAQ